MTFSILVRDDATGIMGGAAATGSLCVGGWVLRGDARAGLSASQGASPSTFWGEDTLTLMKSGMSATDAVAAVTQPDAGRDARQLSVLDRDGRVAAFTGADNTPAMGSRLQDNQIVAGNLLRSETVLDAIADGFQSTSGALPDRLLTALNAGERAGSDSRGLMSAALLIVGNDRPPLSLRVDYSETPLEDLSALLQRARDGAYAEWLHLVPVLDDPFRRPVGALPSTEASDS